MKRTLRSPTPATALPLRVATWTYKEPGTSRVRLLVAAEVQRGSDESLLYSAGLLVATKEGKVIAALDPSERALAEDGLLTGLVIDENTPDYGRGDFLIRAIHG